MIMGDTARHYPIDDGQGRWLVWDRIYGRSVGRWHRTEREARAEATRLNAPPPPSQPDGPRFRPVTVDGMSWSVCDVHESLTAHRHPTTREAALAYANERNAAGGYPLSD